MFGREKGAYTGALTKQVGRFELANGSTLFLDEIGELPLELQAKLLRVVQEGQFERLGSPKTISVDVRIIAATNRDLAERVKEGLFRQDLYFRLNVFPIHVPPLRERQEDIPLLTWRFVRELERKMGKKIESIPRKTMEMLQRYPWPGNVRELRNAVEQALIVTSGNQLHLQMPDPREATLLPTLKGMEHRHILAALEQTGWRIKGTGGAAELLGMKPSTLYTTMRRLGIPAGARRTVFGPKDGMPSLPRSSQPSRDDSLEHITSAIQVLYQRSPRLIQVWQLSCTLADDISCKQSLNSMLTHGRRAWPKRRSESHEQRQTH